MLYPRKEMLRDARLLATGANAEVKSAIEAVVGKIDKPKPSERTWMANPIVQAIFVIALYFPVALYLRGQHVARDTSVMRRPFEHIAGNSYVSYHFIQGTVGDSVEFPQRSTLVLYEDDKQLGPAHSPHSDITVHGRGRYSQWFLGHEGYIIIFSSSDNSDPNTNGRTYRAINSRSAR